MTEHIHTGNCRCIGKGTGIYDSVKTNIIGKTIEEAKKIFSGFTFVISDYDVVYSNYVHVSVDEYEKIISVKVKSII